jgi:hypothetical protein
MRRALCLVALALPLAACNEWEAEVYKSPSETRVVVGDRDGGADLQQVFEACASRELTLEGYKNISYESRPVHLVYCLED